MRGVINELKELAELGRYREIKPVLVEVIADLAEANAAKERLWDLCRHQRTELYEAKLITNDEYVAFAEDHAAAERLETYSQLRAAWERQEKALNLVVSWRVDAKHGTLYLTPESAIADCADELESILRDGGKEG